MSAHNPAAGKHVFRRENGHRVVDPRLGLVHIRAVETVQKNPMAVIRAITRGRKQYETHGATQIDGPFVNPLCISAVGEPDIDVCRNQVDWRLKA